MSTAVLKPSWNPASIAVMVIGFIVFWPLGLAMLGYILWGDNMKCNWDNKKFKMPMMNKDINVSTEKRTSGNSAFDAYRQETLDRLEAERKKLEQDQREFEAFMARLKQAQDEEEFQKFMSERNAKSSDIVMPN